MDVPGGRRAIRAWTLAVAVAAGSAGCLSAVGTTASSFLKNAQSNPDPNLRHQAFANLGDPTVYDTAEQKARAVKVLCQSLESPYEPLATKAVICRSLGELGDPAARPALLKAVEHPETIVRAQACRALGKVGLPEDGAVLARIMAVDRDPDGKIAAIEGLGALRAIDERIATVLVDGMEHEDPAIRLASVRALRSVSGKDLGVESGPWRAYAESLGSGKPAEEEEPETWYERLVEWITPVPRPDPPARASAPASTAEASTAEPATPEPGPAAESGPQPQPPTQPQPPARPEPEPATMPTLLPGPGGLPRALPSDGDGRPAATGPVLPEERPVSLPPADPLPGDATMPGLPPGPGGLPRALPTGAGG